MLPERIKYLFRHSTTRNSRCPFKIIWLDLESAGFHNSGSIKTIGSESGLFSSRTTEFLISAYKHMLLKNSSANTDGNNIFIYNQALQT